MATRYEAIKAAYKEHVLPHFPNAKRRFKKHFRASYEILRLAEADLEVDFAFTMLGLKPLSLIEGWHPSKEFKTMLSEAGLETRIRTKSEPCTPPGTEVFDPELVAEPLSKMLNRHIDPEDAKEAVKEADYFDYHSHELLGYPQPLPWFSPLDALFRTVSYLHVCNINRHHRWQKTGRIRAEYFSSYGCIITDIPSVVNILLPLASAAAITEEIRDSPRDIISIARISTGRVFLSMWGIEKGNISTTIQRTGKPAEWIID